MKKIISFTLISLLVICIITSVYAASCTMNLQTAKNEFNKDEEFVVEVVLSNIQDEKGIIALGATLEYDKNSLTMKKMENLNRWTEPFYNEANGKFTMDRNGFTTTDETILKITFKLNGQDSKNTTIKIKDIIVSNGEKDIIVGDITKTINIKEETPTPPTNTITNTTTNTVTNTTTNTVVENKQNEIINGNNTNQDNSIKGGELPKTGETATISMLVVFSIGLAIAIFFYVKTKRVNIK